MRYHVTGTYHIADVLLGQTHAQDIAIDAYVEAGDPTAAKDEATLTVVRHLPDWEDRSDLTVTPAPLAGPNAAEQTSRQYSELLFPLE